MLIDENIPKDVEDWLSKKGFKPVNVSKLLLKTAKDHAIMQHATKNQMTIITLDKSFAQLYRTFQKNTPLTVIIIKVNPPTPINIIKTLNLAQNKINLKDIQNKLVIITKRKIRIIT